MYLYLRVKKVGYSKVLILNIRTIAGIYEELVVGVFLILFFIHLISGSSRVTLVVTLAVLPQHFLPVPDCHLFGQVGTD